MNILIILDSKEPWRSGIWFHRNETPATALKLRGHAVRQVPLEELNKTDIDWTDTVIFGRTYHPNLQPIDAVKAFKAKGKRVLYDMDDDFWQVAKSNPSALVSNAFKDQYESFVRECDAVITPSKVLAEKFKKLVKKKPVFICPNGIDFEKYYFPRAGNNQKLTVGYMGASSHWEDLYLVADALIEISKKHDFNFVLYGLCSEPIEAAVYAVQKILEQNSQPARRDYHASILQFWDKMKQVQWGHHVFMTPELHPGKLSFVNFDIGIAPLVDNEFNRGKSCIKFYEYAAVGTATLASDVEPYKSEVNYRAKNTTKDWVAKLEKLIVDKDFREKLAKEQMEWVKKYRSTGAIGVLWEIACQRPSNLEVLNQKGWKKILNPFKK